MQLGKQLEWALHCAGALAALPPEKRLAAMAMAELFEVPPKYLAKALQALARAGLISSTSGPRGGYALAKPASEIRLLDVVDAVQGGGRLFRCQEIRRRGPCRGMPAKLFSPTCQIADAMWRAEEAWRNELASITLADLLKSVNREVSPILLGAVGDWVQQRLT